MFRQYGDGGVVMPGMQPKTVVQAAAGLGAALSALVGLVFVARKKK
jgi:LPXTG-motif cell wall-anchored protein